MTRPAVPAAAAAAAAGTVQQWSAGCTFVLLHCCCCRRKRRRGCWAGVAAILRIWLQVPRPPQQRCSSGSGKLGVGNFAGAIDGGAVAAGRVVLWVLQCHCFLVVIQGIHLQESKGRPISTRAGL